MSYFPVVGLGELKRTVGILRGQNKAKELLVKGKHDRGRSSVEERSQQSHASDINFISMKVGFFQQARSLLLVFNC